MVIPVRDLLTRIADEVQVLADVARSVEKAGIVGTSGNADNQQFKSIQEVDRLVQSLGDISAFVRACSAAFDAEDQVVEIGVPVSEIKLQTIRERLSGAKSTTRADPHGGHGRLHLF